ncbi:TonB-dependent receptor [Asticcacaulis sp. BYS171W]|uniref:TonB-dependent receptor n=1 Tax=Asticcacaulis aquaticus TaxID=2984212 RepID=A0ABT5HVW3_9CAUL|nr:TonB-dependent receptor [Asticcacaulis aquaticus]MDC7684179.1 TonB-dependent receptor [Asticcacaulis aquaticus]
MVGKHLALSPSFRARLKAGISAGVLMAAGLAAMGVHAQEAKPDTDVTEVVVKGYRSSLAKALSIKRNSTGVVDSIIAEDIAKFPDNNLAESIQRVPGVSISRDQGEGRSLSVRGLGPDFTRVQINGMESQASTDGLAGGTNRGRGFDFNVFASELFSRIDVNKTASARLPEGSLGATVDLYTGHPFDYKGMKAAASGQMSYNDQSGRRGYRTALLWSNTFADDTLGVLVSAAYSTNPIDFQQSNSGNWNQGNGDGGFCKPTTGTGGLCDVPASELAAYTALYNKAMLPTTYNPRFYRYVHTKGDVERLGLTGSLQWKPSDATTFTADLLYSQFETRQDNYTMEPIGFSRGASQGGKPETLVRALELDSNNTAVYGVFDNVDMRSEHNLDEFTTRFTQVTLRAEHDFSDRLHFDGMIGWSLSDFDNYLDLATQIDRFNVDGYSFDIRSTGQAHPSINYGFDVTNPGNWYFGPRVTQPGGTGSTGPEIRLRPNYTDNEYKLARGGFVYKLGDELNFHFGAEWKEYYFEAVAYRYASGEADWPAYTGNMADITQQFCGLDDFNPPSPSPKCWTVPNIDAYISKFGILSGAGRATISETVAAARGDNRSVTERDTSVYAMLDFNVDINGMRLRGDMGVRQVRTEQKSNFYTNVPTTVNPSGFVYTTVERSYDDFLPSMNFILEPTSRTAVRFSAARVMVRPPLVNIAAATSVSVAGGSRTVSTGNPNLTPYRANTADLSFEWYPNSGSILSVGFFYKDIKTYIQSVTRIAPYSSTGLPDSLIANTGVAASDDFAISNVINTPGGPLKGFEINYQQPFTFLPGILSNFGTLLNYTYVDSQIDYFTSTAVGATTVTADLLNLSKKAYNATLYYEKGPFQARVSMNYRDRYLRAVPGPFNMDVSGINAATYYDASMSYQVTDRVSVSLEALNFGNEPHVSWVDSKAQRVEDYREGGRQFYLGVRYNY